MKLAICITTRNRPVELDQCLKAIAASTQQPHEVIVSDDSIDPLVQEQNSDIVSQYPNARFILGPRKGVCANRNNAVNHVKDTDYVSFVDDDIYIEPDFLQLSADFYEAMPEADRFKTILSGVSYGQEGQDLHPAKLSFRGYFSAVRAGQPYETVVIHAAVFPRSFFQEEQWDENIYFGYEDGELCLRAIKRGYGIRLVPNLKVYNSCFDQGTLIVPSVARLTDYQIYLDAARLYIGVKRYKYVFPNIIKLYLFIFLYFTHILIFLSKNRSLKALPEIFTRSRVSEIWNIQSLSPLS